MLTKKQRKSSRFFNDVKRHMDKFGYAKMDWRNAGHRGRQVMLPNGPGKDNFLSAMAALQLPQKKG